MIPYGHQSIDDSDIQAVVEVLKGDWLTQGPKVEEFEEEIKRITQAKYAVAFSHGTAALHGTMTAAEIGNGNKVITSPLSFVASANCAIYVGAEIDFVDIDEQTLNIDSKKMKKCDAAVLVHFGGLPVDVSPFRKFSKVIIEDGSHAFGSKTPNGPIGNCSDSDMCVFSFHPVKTITTGEGGIVTTNNPKYENKLRRFRNHDMVKKPEYGGWFYEIEDLGFNYRLTDIQAALGISQLKKLETFISTRNQIAKYYDENLSNLGITLPTQPNQGYKSAYHLYPIRTKKRSHLYEILKENEIITQVHYIPIHLHKYYKNRGFKFGDFPVSEKAYAELLSLPIYPDLSMKEQKSVISTIEHALKT